MDAPDRDYLLSLVRRDAATPRQYTYKAIRDLLLRFGGRGHPDDPLRRPYPDLAEGR